MRYQPLPSQAASGEFGPRRECKERLEELGDVADLAAKTIRRPWPSNPGGIWWGR
jgi:hypothetical protein